MMIKRILSIISAACLLCSCVMYSDKDSESMPRQSLLWQFHTCAIRPVLEMAELADFYEAYLQIWEDRPAALSLAREYFDQECMRSLDSQRVSVRGWGTISSTNLEGRYIGQSDYESSMMSDMNVVSLGDRRFQISMESTDEHGVWQVFLFDAVVRAEDDKLVLESLYAKYVDSEDGVVQMNAEGEAIGPKLKDNFYAYPFGAFRYEVRGVVSDDFFVRYDGIQPVILDRL